MATIRRAGFGTVFELEDSKVGIGTDAATHTLQALGNIRSEAATDIGISSLSTYQGFTDKEARFTTGHIDNQSQSGSTSGEIVIDGDVTVSSATTFTSGPQHLTVTDTFTLPSGDTNSRALKPTAGSLRFNQDFATLEFYTGNNWATVNTFTEMQNSPGNRGRGIIHLGFDSPADLKTIHFVNISSKGNSQHFGDLSEARRLEGAASSETRGVFGGGQVSPSEKDTIDYITIQSEGDAIDFGNLGSTRTIHQAFSSSTRAVWGGSYNAPGFSNVMEYVEIGTLGNALDFGDAVNSGYSSMAVSSPTRGILAGGYTSTWFSSIDFFTIASKGNGTFFGELTTERRAGGRASNAVRGIFAGGAQGPGPAYVNNIDYVTIASAGNAIHFGDLTYSDTLYAVGTSNQTRGIFATGYPSSKTIDSVEIATTGDATDFGEISWPNNLYGGSAVSDSHGGLGGF